MVKKYFRNSIAGACMAMSMLLGATSVTSVVALADEVGEEEQETQDTKMSEESAEEEEKEETQTEKVTEAETVPDTSGEAETSPDTEAAPEPLAENGDSDTEDTTNRSEASITQDVMSPEIGDTVKQTVTVSYNKAEDTTITYDIDSEAMDLGSIEVSADSPLYGGTMKITYADGTKDLDINANPMDLSEYEGISKVEIKPAVSEEEYSSASFVAVFTITAVKENVKNTVKVESTYGDSEDANLEFSTSDPQNESESESESETSPETQPTDPDPDDPDEPQTSEPEPDESEAPESTAAVSMSQDVINPGIGESFSQTVNVSYDKAEDTEIDYVVDSAVTVTGIEIARNSCLFGGTLTVIYDGGEEDIAINSTSIGLSGYSGITELVIFPANTDESASGAFTVSMKMSKMQESVTTEASVTSSYGGEADTSLTFNPAYCVVDTPEVECSADTVEFGDSATITFGNIGAHFYGVTGSIEFEIGLADSVDLVRVKLPTLYGASDISLYGTKNGKESLIGIYPSGTTVDIDAAGYTQIRLVANAEESTVYTTGTGRIVLLNNQESLDKGGVYCAFRGITTATVKGTDYTGSSERVGCRFLPKEEEQTEEPEPTLPPETEGSDGDDGSSGQTVEGSDSGSSAGSGSGSSGVYDGGTVYAGSDGSDNTSESTGTSDDGSGDIKQDILQRSLDNESNGSSADKTEQLNDRINSIINSATSGSGSTSDEDEDEESSSEHTSPYDPETYEDWKVKPVFEDIIANLVKIYVDPIDESLIASVVPGEEPEESEITEEEETDEEESEEVIEDETE